MRRQFCRRVVIMLILILFMVLAIGGWWLRARTNSPTRETLNAWFNDPASRPSLIRHLGAPCPGASFRLPSEGFIGLLYGDSAGLYSPLNPHPGIDIFGEGAPSSVPVFAAHDSYQTRLPDWKSAVSLRI